MPMYLLNDEARQGFGFATVAWQKVIELAEMGGWTPAGAPVSRYLNCPKPCDGSRESCDRNEAQTVTAEDAAAMAAAIEKMLPDIPDERKQEVYSMVSLEQAVEQMYAYPIVLFTEHVFAGDILACVPNPSASPSEFFSGVGSHSIVERDKGDSRWQWYSGEGKLKLRDFIDFCRKGSFNIG